MQADELVANICSSTANTYQHIINIAKLYTNMLVLATEDISQIPEWITDRVYSVFGTSIGFILYIPYDKKTISGINEWLKTSPFTNMCNNSSSRDTYCFYLKRKDSGYNCVDIVMVPNVKGSTCVLVPITKMQETIIGYDHICDEAAAEMSNG